MRDKIKLMNKVSNKGFPVKSKYYKEDQAESDKKELIGKNTRAGKIEAEKKYKKYKDEIAFHERE